MNENMNVKVDRRLSLSAKVGYSVGTFGESLACNFYYLFFLFFLTDIAGISPFAAGTISLFATIWSAITDPLVGHLSDKSKNSKGRRRPFILKYSIPLGIALILLYTDFGLSGPAQVIYFLIGNIFFWFILSAVDVPYMVLGGEISRIHQERLSLRWLCNSFNYIGYALVGYTLYFVAKAETFFKDINSSWTFTAVIFGIAIAASFLLSYVSTKGREPIYQEEEVVERVNLFTSIKKGLKIAPYRNVWLYTVFMMGGIMIFTSDQVYLFSYCLGANETQISTIYLIYAIMVIALSPLMSKLGKMLGNRTTLLLSILLTTIGFAVYWIIPLNMYTIWGVLLACAVGVAGFFVNAYAMVYDVADVAELKTGIKNEGILLAFFSFCIKLSTAIAMWLLGIFLAFYKYDPEVQMTQTVLNGIKTSGTIIPAVICAISFLLHAYKSMLK